MASQAIELKKLGTLTTVLGHLAEGKKVSESCELAGIPQRTFQSWIQDGSYDELFREMKQNLTTQTLAQVSEAWPQALRLLCQDVADTELSPRDRDQRFRSLLLLMKQVVPDLAEPQHTGEAASSWLKRHSFGPLVVVEGDVNISKTDSNEGEAVEIVEGQVRVVEEAPQPQHPLLVDFPDDWLEKQRVEEEGECDGDVRPEDL